MSVLFALCLNLLDVTGRDESSSAPMSDVKLSKVLRTNKSTLSKIRHGQMTDKHKCFQSTNPLRGWGVSQVSWRCTKLVLAIALFGPRLDIPTLDKLGFNTSVLDVSATLAADNETDPPYILRKKSKALLRSVMASRTDLTNPGEILEEIIPLIWQREIEGKPDVSADPDPVTKARLVKNIKGNWNSEGGKIRNGKLSVDENGEIVK